MVHPWADLEDKTSLETQQQVEWIISLLPDLQCQQIVSTQSIVYFQDQHNSYSNTPSRWISSILFQKGTHISAYLNQIIKRAIFKNLFMEFCKLF